MDNNDNGQAPATDDQELAQVLAGMNQQVTDQPTETQPAAAAPTTDGGMQFEETGAAPTPPTLPEASIEVAPTEPAVDLAAPDPVVPEPVIPEPIIAPTPEVLPAPAVTSEESAHAPTVSPELEAIKKDALEQLRPLVDKLDLPAQEKFDTLLLIIRSTDDQSLLTAANEAAKTIEDDGKRAEALLDIIKEIDFFSNPAHQ